MHGRWFHQRNYQANSVKVTGDGANWIQALGQSRNRRGVKVSLSLANVTAARFLVVQFGQMPANPADPLAGHSILNSVQGSDFFSYEEWGDAIQQEINIYVNAALAVLVTEIVDSTPECECYGN